jgi:pimeloyl-ACP methyl ester carboxylesterase
VTTLDVDGATLHYELTGAGPHTVAFVHGWCSKAEHWAAQASHLGRSQRVLCWDRRGMGRSTTAAPAGSARRHADDLVALLDHCGIERAVVVGHAGGGPTALTMAAEHASRTEALVMVDTTVNRPGDDRSARFVSGVHEMAAALQGPDGPERFARIYAGFFGPRADPAVVADAVAHATSRPLDVAVSELLQMAEDTAALAARVTCPVLWVSAQPLDAAFAREAFPSTRPLVGHVVGSGHFVQVEVPEQLNPMLDVLIGTLPG